MRATRLPIHRVTHRPGTHALLRLVAAALCVAAASAVAAATGSSNPAPPDSIPLVTPRESAAVAPVDSAAIGTARDTASVASSDTSSAPVEVQRGQAASDATLIGALVGAGLENVSVDRFGPTLRVVYENRRYRHAVTALGVVTRTAGEPLVAQERRLGQIAAELPAGDLDPPAPVRYPSDGGFVAAASEGRAGRTERTLDLVLRPQFTYELGRIFDPVLVRIELQPELRWNPWPGARARAAVVIPVYDNYFDVDSLHPDVERVRPGVISLEQFVWTPGVALVSGTAGLLGKNRYGLSVGIARPLAGGLVLLDSQADLTGFVAFTDHGTEVSTPRRWSGFAGLSVRPGALDLAVRARAARFLHGDRGVELELKRSMGDLDVAFFGQRVAGLNVTGVRLAVPLPPADRPVRTVRVMPVERFPIEYRDEATPVGRYLGEVASREDYLRQLDPGALAANADRYVAARNGVPRPRPQRPRPPWVSWTGMTGFVNTPWCGVMPDRTVEVGYNRIPQEAAYDHRDEHRNDVYYIALGFLPRVEAGLRWTVIPGLKTFADDVPESRLTDADRMLSGRVEMLVPRPGRPGLALGVEDAMGTRRFHSTYIAAGIPIENRGLQSRFSLGYAPRIFKASRRTLDGVFGAIELSPWRPVAGVIEHDTEKWNVSLGVDLVLGLRARLALLDLRHPSAGVGWQRSL